MIRRLPIRARAATAATAAMAAVLLALALFLHARLASGLDAELDRLLTARAQDVATLVSRGQDPTDVLRSVDADDDEQGVFAQLVEPDGLVVARTAGLPDRPLVDRAALDEAAGDDDGVVIGRARRAGGDDDDDAASARLLARAVDESEEKGPIIIVGATLADRDESLRSLDTALAVGVPAALVLAALAGWTLAAAALRPMESMRRRADRISTPGGAERLPVPSTRDEVARLGTTLNEMLDRQAAGVRRERAFIADASHELRTPLTVLLTELDLALRGDRSAGELREALVGARREAHGLAQLAEDLLVLARGPAGLPLHRAPQDVGRLLAETVDRHRSAFAGAGRALGAEPVAAGLVVDADPDRLRQALDNLVTNALAHGDGEATLAATGHGERVALHVLDRGEGAPPAVRDVAFERFTSAPTGSTSRSRPGTGLGLAIVAAIAEAHGGAAGLDPRPDGGTDAWLTLSSSSHRAAPTVDP